jgi:hypothetical protein
MRGRRRVTEARLKGHVSCASAKLFAVSLSGGHYHPRRLDATSKILEKQKEQKKMLRKWNVHVVVLTGECYPTTN